MLLILRGGGVGTSGPPAALDFRQALMLDLKSLGDLTSVVAARIYPSRRPQSATRPNLIVRVTGMPRVRQIDGPAGITSAEVEFELEADSISQCVAAQHAIAERWDGVARTISDVAVTSAVCQTEADETYETSDGSDQPFHRCTSQWIFHHRA